MISIRLMLACIQALTATALLAFVFPAFINLLAIDGIEAEALPINYLCLALVAISKVALVVACAIRKV